VKLARWYSSKMELGMACVSGYPHTCTRPREVGAFRRGNYRGVSLLQAGLDLLPYASWHRIYVSAAIEIVIAFRLPAAPLWELVLCSFRVSTSHFDSPQRGRSASARSGRGRWGTARPPEQLRGRGRDFRGSPVWSGQSLQLFLKPEQPTGLR
jgi:hypothetical protein